MSFTKVTLSLVMICSVAQASEPKKNRVNRELAKLEKWNPTLLEENFRKQYVQVPVVNNETAKVENMKSEIQKKKTSPAFSYFEKAVLTTVAFCLAITGWDAVQKAHEKHLFETSIQNLPIAFDSCVKESHPKNACYDKCFHQVFARTEKSDRPIDKYVDQVDHNLWRCTKAFFKTENDGSYKKDGKKMVHLSNDECIVAVVDHVRNDKACDREFQVNLTIKDAKQCFGCDGGDNAFEGEIVRAVLPSAMDVLLKLLGVAAGI